MTNTKQSTQIFDFGEHELKVDKEISNRFKVSFMSNAKWRKCFTLLNQVAEPDLQVIWKFVAAQNNGVRDSLPPDEALDLTYLNDSFWFGPLYYKEIEWIDFPRVRKPYGKEKIPATFSTQDIESIRTALVDIGSWQIEDSEDGFRIYGHK